MIVLTDRSVDKEILLSLSDDYQVEHRQGPHLTLKKSLPAVSGLWSQTISGPADYQYLSHKISTESRQLERAEAIKVHQSLIKKNQCATNVENCSHGERLDEWRVSQSECSSIELSGQRSVAHTEPGWQSHLFLAPPDFFP